MEQGSPMDPRRGGQKGGGQKGGRPTQQKWGPEGWEFEGWGPEGWEAQNFAFFPSPAAKFVLFFPLWVSPGFTPRAQTFTFEGPGLQNTTKIQREDTQRGKKRTNFFGERGKKRGKFWAGWSRPRKVLGRAVWHRT